MAQSLEARALRRSNEVFKKGVDPDSLVTILYSNERLTPDEKSKATQRMLTDEQKLEELFKALEKRINTNPYDFHELVKALRSEPAMKTVGDKLQGIYDELKHDVNSEASPTKPSSTGQRGLILSAMPSLAQLRRLKTSRGPDIRIIDQVAPKWDTLAIEMDFDQKGDTLAAIRKDFSSVLDCCTETFRLWLDGKGNRQPATWSTLLEILDDCDLGNLAQDIQKVFYTNKNV